MQKKGMKKTSHFVTLSIIAFTLLSCAGYGDKVAKDFVEIYYKDGITETQAQKTLDVLYPSWNEAGNKKSVQLTKKADTIYFRMVINEEKAKGIKDESYLMLAAGLSSSIFNNAPVNVVLTDNRFNPLRTFHFQPFESSILNGKITSGNVEVYTRESVSESEGNRLAAFLDRLDGETQQVKSFQLEKDGEGVYIVSMVSAPEQAATVPEQEFYSLVQLVSDSVFSSSATNLRLTNDHFQPYQTFRHPR
jgi:hypothetical protein